MGSIVIDEVAETLSLVDVTITFPFSTTAEGVVAQKVGTITITGANGISNILIGLAGAGGLPSPPSAVNVTIIEHDATPADPVVTIVDPGGPGEAADWTLDIETPQGDPGEPGAFALEDATDLTGTVEVATAKYVVTVNSAGDGFEPTPPRVCAVKWPTSVSSTSLTNTTPRALASVSVTAGETPHNCRPVVHGYSIVTGSSDVRVDLVAYLGDPDSGGKEIGRGPGLALGTAGVDRVMMIPTYPTTHTGDDGMIPAGTAASIYLRAVNLGNASANWSTSDSSTRFWVEFLTV